MPNSDRSKRQSERHPESHHVSRTGWLRAAVLGANDGILSTASLILGVAALRPIFGLGLACLLNGRK
jgi:VIT1/CCC1 family predicted Fe2+/Mn2+ transporter